MVGTAVFYEIYIRSFADGDGDGVGDCREYANGCPTLPNSASTRSG